MCRGRRARILLHLHMIYSGKREACEGAKLVSVLFSETIHPACILSEEDAGGVVCCLLLHYLIQNCARVTIGGKQESAW